MYNTIFCILWNGNYIYYYRFYKSVCLFQILEQIVIFMVYTVCMLIHMYNIRYKFLMHVSYVSYCICIFRTSIYFIMRSITIIYSYSLKSRFRQFWYLYSLYIMVCYVEYLYRCVYYGINMNVICIMWSLLCLSRDIGSVVYKIAFEYDICVW